MSDHDLAAKLPQDHFAAPAMLIALMLVSCSGTRPDPLEGAARASAIDSAIVQAAALDFLENGNCFEGTGKNGIVVVDETLPVAALADLRLDELTPDMWEDDLASGLPNLRARNGPAQPIDWHFSDQTTIKDVVLKGSENIAIYEASELGKCITEFALPGIHAEGQRATVVFSIHPEDHGRMYVMSLHLVDGAWRVERRHNFDYL